MAEASGPPAELVYSPPAEPFLDIVHEDPALLVLNKPSGLLTVPGKPADHADCLEARAQARFPQALTVHRLDMATSGLCVMARTPAAQRHLGLQFEKRQVEKTYIAVVGGEMTAESGRIEGAMRTDWPRRPLQMIDHAHGRSAVTDWEVIGRQEGSTRVRLRPLTGRSHQLRVHLAWIGHPILGDDFYAPPDLRAAAPRLLLHAETLGFRHPVGGEPVSFEAPCPF